MNPNDLSGKWIDLEANQVHVWHASCDLPSAGLAILEQLLSEEECSRANRFYFERDRRSFVVAHGFLRRLLAKYTRSSAASIQFCYGAHNKPALAGSTRLELNFNLSHSGNLIVYAFALSRQVGIDVERMRADVDFPALAKTSFSVKEQQAVLALQHEGRSRLFYEYWTCKEACIKADGRGLSVPLDQFRIVASPRGPAWRQIVQERQGVFATDWQIRILDVAANYAAALCGAGTDWEIIARNVDDLGKVA